MPKNKYELMYFSLAWAKKESHSSAIKLPRGNLSSYLEDFHFHDHFHFCFMFTFTSALPLSLSGTSKPPDPRECEEARRELLGGHPPSFGHCQGEQHEAAEAEEGGNIFSNNMLT